MTQCPWEELYLHKNDLVRLLAVVGNWVPAKQAKVGIADRIFGRVGDGDDLVTGESTLMVEMAETDNIVNQARDNSLVLIGEMGRGTTTFDGLSTACKVSKHLETDRCNRRVLATRITSSMPSSGTLKM